MNVLVKVFANLRKICGGVTANVEIKGNRVIDLLEQMIQDYPGLEEEILTLEKN